MAEAETNEWPEEAPETEGLGQKVSSSSSSSSAAPEVEEDIILPPSMSNEGDGEETILPLSSTLDGAGAQSGSSWLPSSEEASGSAPQRERSGSEHSSGDPSTAAASPEPPTSPLSWKRRQAELLALEEEDDQEASHEPATETESSASAPQTSLGATGKAKKATAKKGPPSYTVWPVIPAEKAELVSVAKAMHRDDLGKRVKALFHLEKEAALKSLQTGLYIGWRCPEYLWDCFRVGDESKCFCGHRLKLHQVYVGVFLQGVKVTQCDDSIECAHRVHSQWCSLNSNVIQDPGGKCALPRHLCQMHTCMHRNNCRGKRDRGSRADGSIEPRGCSTTWPFDTGILSYTSICAASTPTPPPCPPGLQEGSACNATPPWPATSLTHKRCVSERRASVPCSHPECKCLGFTFVPSRPEEVGEFWLRRRTGFDAATWRAKCRCKHTHEEHTPTGVRACCAQGCSCTTFASNFLCAACDRRWEEHETFFESEETRRKGGRPCGEAYLPFAEMPDLRNALLTGHPQDNSAQRALQALPAPSASPALPLPPSGPRRLPEKDDKKA